MTRKAIYDVDEPLWVDGAYKISLIKTNYRCFACNEFGRGRSGVGFEHELICMKCNVVWEPDKMCFLVEE